MSDSNSYRSIIKATSLIGGASVLAMFFNMIRTKVIAVLLGAEGVGFFGVFMNILNLFSVAMTLGLGTSGVKILAEQYQNREMSEVRECSSVILQILLYFGIFGMLLMAGLCYPLSVFSFHSSQFYWAILLLSVGVLLKNLINGQRAILQGCRKIPQIALLNILDALFMMLFGIPCYYFFGMNGIVSGLVIALILSCCMGWVFLHKPDFQFSWVSFSVLKKKSTPMLALGIGFVFTAFVGTGIDYLARVVIIKNAGIILLGIYDAAFSLSGIFVNFVLGAMATDYYPRLAAVVNDSKKFQRTLMEQAEIVILVATPGLVLMMMLADIIIPIFYASSFAQAIPILKIFIIAVYGRVLSWPFSYAIMAKGDARAFVAAETSMYILRFVLLYWGVLYYGIAGAAWALVGAYFLYIPLVLFICFHKYHLHSSHFLSLLRATAGLVILLTFFNNFFMRHWFNWGLDVILFAGVGIGALAILKRRLNLSWRMLKGRFMHE